MMTTGMINLLSFASLFNKQKANQIEMLKNGSYDRFKKVESLTLPTDDIGLMSYHIQQLMSEIGEILDADKRWKNFRNEKYDKANKAEEIADCFIVLMNIAMFSGIDGDELAKIIYDKIEKVAERVAKQGIS